GELPYFDYAQWQGVLAVLGTPAADPGTPLASAPPQRSLAEYLRLIDINLGTLVILGQELEGINVQVTHAADGWHLQGENLLLAGRFMLPDDSSAPWLVDLDYLR